MHSPAFPAAAAGGTVDVDYGSSGRVTLTCAGVVTTPPTTTTTPAPLPTLVVNEVSTGTTVSGADEFVELLNTGSSTVDLSGVRVVYRAAAGTSDTTLVVVPAGTTLAPGAFYLIAGAAYAGAAAADQSFSVGLAAAGGAVGIRDDAGALVDGVGWGTAANALVEGSPAPAPPSTAPPGASLARVPDGHDTGSNAADLIVSSAASPRSSNR